ncbi:MAG TPA: hypothetical protein PKK60_00940 [archaeon]|nr:hypothetical protein [archaeon]
MQKPLNKLKHNGEYATTRVSIFGQEMELKNRRRAKTVRTMKGRMEFIKRLKTQQKGWERLWKTLLQQRDNPKNQANKKSIENAIKICEENFKLTDAKIAAQKQQIKQELKKP